MDQSASNQGRPDAGDLVVRTWSERTRDRFGSLPDGWAGETTIRLAHAAAAGADLAAVSNDFGRAQYLAGSTHAETLQAIEDLAGSCPPTDPRQALAMMQGAARGWVDAMTCETVSLPHRDLLTGLPTTGFVVVASELLYRPGAVPAASHRLVIAHMPAHLRGAGRIAALLRLGERARSLFDDGCTVAALGSLGVIVLAEHTAGNTAAARSLAPGNGPMPGTSVCVDALPPTQAEVEPQIARHARYRLRPVT